MLYDSHGRAVSPQVEQYRLSDSSFLHQLSPFTIDNQALPGVKDFWGLADRFYRRNVVVYAAIRALSRSAAEPEFVACKLEDGKEVVSDPATDPLAALIAQPNPNQETYEFIEQLVIHLQVAGNAFVKKVRARAGNVIRLELIRPDLVNIEAMKRRDGTVVPRYSIGEGKEKQTFRVGDVIQFKLPDAFDPFWGLSPLYVLATYGDIDQQSTEFLRSYFLNRGVPAGMLTVKGHLMDEDREELKDKWREQFAGPDGWHRLPVMDREVAYQELGTGLKEIRLDPVFNQAETRIAAVFGVPPIIIGTNAGLQRSTFSNFKESRRGFWTETLVPMYTRITRRLTRFLAQEDFGSDRLIKADVSKVAGLQDNKEALRKLSLKGWDLGLFTVNEARDILDMPPIDDEVVGDSLKLSTVTLYVPRSQATQFADLTGDVVSDVVQSEIIESEKDKIRGVGDPNPKVGEEDDPDPPEQKLAELKELKKRLAELERELRSESFTNEDLLNGDDDEIETYVKSFPEESQATVTMIVDRLVAGDLPHNAALRLLFLMQSLEPVQMLTLYNLARGMVTQGKTGDEINIVLNNAFAILKEQKSDDSD